MKIIFTPKHKQPWTWTFANTIAWDSLQIDSLKDCILFVDVNWIVLTVAPGQDAKFEDTWNFFIVSTVRGGKGE